MRINVDGSALRDPRVKFLASATGLDRFGVLGRLLEVWGLCYDRVSANLPAAHIDAVAEHAGFAVAMVEAELAVDAGGLIRVCGAERRITYLQGQAERGRSGGLARVKQTLGERLSETVAVAKPSGSGSPPDPDPDHLRIPEREEAPATPALLSLVAREPAKPDPVGDLWAEQERLRADAIPTSRRLALTADRRKKIAALLKSGHTADDLRACLAAYAAEARTNGGEWFNGESNWVAANVARTLGRIGTTTTRAPPAQPATGRAPPAVIDSTETWDPRTITPRTM